MTDSRSGRCILVTGGSGQLGLALQHALASEEVTALSHSDLDVTDETAVLETIDDLTPAIVIHAAAWTDTAGCEQDPERAKAVNARAAALIIDEFLMGNEDLVQFLLRYLGPLILGFEFVL